MKCRNVGNEVEKESVVGDRNKKERKKERKKRRREMMSKLTRLVKIINSFLKVNLCKHRSLMDCTYCTIRPCTIPLL